MDLKIQRIHLIKMDLKKNPLNTKKDSYIVIFFYNKLSQKGCIHLNGYND